MDEDQLIRLWWVIGGTSLALLFIGALTNKIVVYRDYRDLWWSLSLTFSPLLSFLTLAFVAGEGTDTFVFARETSVGKTVTLITLVFMAWSTLKTYLMSVQDNGLILGIFVGTAKVLIAAVMALFAIGLIRYLFRDERKLGHVAIFFLLFGVLTWIMNVLVNGERIQEARR